jgi:hypothetical protein
MLALTQAQPLRIAKAVVHIDPGFDLIAVIDDPLAICTSTSASTPGRLSAPQRELKPVSLMIGSKILAILWLSTTASAGSASTRSWVQFIARAECCY